MIEEKMKRLLALCESASPGPWKFQRTDLINCGGQLVERLVDDITDAQDAAVVKTDSGIYPPDIQDARVIVAGRSELPVLIAEVRRLRKVIHDFEAELRLRADLVLKHPNVIDHAKENVWASKHLTSAADQLAAIRTGELE